MTGIQETEAQWQILLGDHELKLTIATLPPPQILVLQGRTKDTHTDTKLSSLTMRKNRNVFI